VKLSTMVSLIGSGSVLFVVGLLLLAFGITYGINESMGIPLWASFCSLGGFSAIVGYFLIDRGSDGTEAEVKKLPIVGMVRSPLWTVGAAFAGGLILARLSRRRKQVVVERVVGDETHAIPVVPEASGGVPESPSNNKEASSFSTMIGDQLRSLGGLASGVALNLGMKALGIPPVEQLLSELLGSEEEPGKKPDAPPMPADATEVRNEHPTGPVYNGARRHDFFNENI